MNDIAKGQVYRHRKSGKLYAVVSVSQGEFWRGLGYIGVRDGKQYGPVRGAEPSKFLLTFKLEPAFRAVFPGISWNFHIEEAK